MATTSKVLGYLPQDTPPFGRMLLLGFQHVLTMFPATVLCALLMNFDVSTVLTITGLGTVVALLGSKFSINTYIPLYYGSSFAYIAAVSSIVGVLEPGLGFGVPAKPETISVVTAGFIVTGILNILFGLLIRVTGGKKGLDKVLPAEITGSVAIIIGIGLAYTALTMASGTCCGVEANMPPTLKWWLAAALTFLAAVVFSVYLQGKGFIGMLPILLAMIFGYLVAIPIGLVDFSSIGSSGLITVPKIVFPVFNNALTATAMIGIGVMAIATIPESTAHLYQISLYIDQLAKELGRAPLEIKRLIGLNLIADGADDVVVGLLGGCAGTNYGENNSLMAITRCYSVPVLMTAGVIAILLGFIGKLAAVVNTLPTAVVGGLSIYLFGVIGMQGIALIQSEKVNLFEPRQLAVGATILVAGIGGAIGLPNGLFPFPIPVIFPNGIPAIVFSAILGILMNLIFLFLPPKMFGIADRENINF